MAWPPRLTKHDLGVYDNSMKATWNNEDMPKAKRQSSEREYYFPYGTIDRSYFRESSKHILVPEGRGELLRVVVWTGNKDQSGINLSQKTLRGITAT